MMALEMQGIGDEGRFKCGLGDEKRSVWTLESQISSSGEVYVRRIQ